MWVEVVVEYGEFMIESKWKQRINETNDDDDNPDLLRYRGTLKLANRLPGRSTEYYFNFPRFLPIVALQFDYILTHLRNAPMVHSRLFAVVFRLR